MRWSSAFSLFALVALAAALAGTAGCGDDNPMSPGGGGGGGNSANITISGFAFSPNPDTVSAGTTVTWTNNDSADHTATSDNSLFNTGTIAGGGGHQSILFSTPGTFAYHCAFHSSMHGTIVVQ